MKKRHLRERLKEDLSGKEFAMAFAEADIEVRLAIRIAEIREQLGMTQAQLAKKLHTKQQEVSRIEQGEQNLTIKKLEEIANALSRKVEIDFVLTKAKSPIAA